MIDFVDDHQQSRNARSRFEQQLALALRERLPGVEHAHGCVDSGQEVACDRRVVAVDRTDPRGIDQLEPGPQQLMIELDARELDATVVGGIPGLGHVLGQLGQSAAPARGRRCSGR